MRLLGAIPSGESYQRGRAPITGDQAWWQLGLPMKNATSGRQGHFLAEWTVIASRTLILLI